MWFIITRFSENDPKFGRVQRTYHWDVSYLIDNGLGMTGHWSSSTASPYKTKEDAEVEAIFLAGRHAMVGDIDIWNLDKVLEYYYPKAT